MNMHTQTEGGLNPSHKNIYPRKICSHCKQEKTTNHFNKNKKAIDGLDYRCKNCISKYQKNYHLSHLKKYKKCLENNKKWRDEHKEELKEKGKEYYKRNKKKLLGSCPNVSSSPRKNFDGSINFEKEAITIKNLKNKVFDKGTDWLLFNPKEFDG